MERLLRHAEGNFGARLRLLRVAARRKRGSSVNLLRSMLSDRDERLMRMAAREIIRRRPPDYQNALLQLMTDAPLSVRRVVSRAIGQTGGLISSAAAITACSFASFLFSPLSSLRQLGFALVIGITVDALLVRPLLVPCGHWLLRRSREVLAPRHQVHQSDRLRLSSVPD